MEESSSNEAALVAAQQGDVSGHQQLGGPTTNMSSTIPNNFDYNFIWNWGLRFLCENHFAIFRVDLC